MNPLLRNAYSAGSSVRFGSICTCKSNLNLKENLYIFRQPITEQIGYSSSSSLGVKLGFEQASPRVYRPW